MISMRELNGQRESAEYVRVCRVQSEDFKSECTLLCAKHVCWQLPTLVVNHIRIAIKLCGCTGLALMSKPLLCGSISKMYAAIAERCQRRSNFQDPPLTALSANPPGSGWPANQPHKLFVLFGNTNLHSVRD